MRDHIEQEIGKRKDDSKVMNNEKGLKVSGKEALKVYDNFPKIFSPNLK